MSSNSSRKKACSNCTKSKVRCSLEKPACSRCTSRAAVCEYPVATAEHFIVDDGELSNNSASASFAQPISGIGTPLSLSTTLDALGSGSSYSLPLASNTREAVKETNLALDFSNLGLVPIIDADQIRVRWFRPFLASPDQIPKAFHPYTLQYISHVLTTYPKQMLRQDGGAPPIIHPLQVSGQGIPLALANCYSLVRMWESRAAGSEVIVVTTLQQEMARLIREHHTFSDSDLLAAFQAYLIYCIMAYFSPIEGISITDDSAMVSLQELAFCTARNGLVCPEELSHSRPKWESWIIVSAKRRAILALYLFSSVYDADKNLPNFVADELKDVYLPACKTLWEANDRSIWEREDSHHLTLWEDGMLKISDLWASPETGSAGHSKRIDRWVQSVDGFGMMLFAICVHIHGC